MILDMGRRIAQPLLRGDGRESKRTPLTCAAYRALREDDTVRVLAYSASTPSLLEPLPVLAAQQPHLRMVPFFFFVSEHLPRSVRMRWVRNRSRVTTPLFSWRSLVSLHSLTQSICQPCLKSSVVPPAAASGADSARRSDRQAGRRSSRSAPGRWGDPPRLHTSRDPGGHDRDYSRGLSLAGCQGYVNNADAATAPEPRTLRVTRVVAGSAYGREDKRVADMLQQATLYLPPPSITQARTYIVQGRTA